MPAACDMHLVRRLVVQHILRTFFCKGWGPIEPARELHTLQSDHLEFYLDVRECCTSPAYLEQWQGMKVLLALSAVDKVTVRTWFYNRIGRLQWVDEAEPQDIEYAVAGIPEDRLVFEEAPCGP